MNYIIKKKYILLITSQILIYKKIDSPITNEYYCKERINYIEYFANIDL